MAEPGDPNYRYSVNEYTTDGTTTEFEVSFDGGYISKEFVRVRYTDSLGAVTYPTFTWVGDYQVSVSPALAAGGSVMIFRNTPADAPVVDFNDGAIINERSLDLTAKQAVHLAAETRDIVGSIPSLDVLQSAMTALQFATSRSNHTGTQPQSSVVGLTDYLAALTSGQATNAAGLTARPTFTQLLANTGAAAVGANDGSGGSLFSTVAGFIAKLLSSSGSSVIGWMQGGIGSVYRSVEDKVRETSVHIRDFGAAMNGTTDDAHAWNKAVTYLISKGGGVLDCSGGQTRLNSTVVIDFSGIWVRGANATNSWIVNGQTNAPAIKFGNSVDLRFRNKISGVIFGQASGVTAVAGNCGLYVEKQSGFVMEDVEAFEYPSKLFQGVVFDRVIGSFVSRCRFQGSLDSNWKLFNQTFDIYIDAVRSDESECGMEIMDCQGLYMSNSACYGNKHAIWLHTSGSSDNNQFLFFNQVIGDTSREHNWKIEQCSLSVFTGCWGSTNKQQNVNVNSDGFWLSGSLVNSLIFQGCVAVSNNRHGMNLDLCSGVQVVNCMLGSNFKPSAFSGQGAKNGLGGAGSGLYLGPYCGRVRVNGGFFEQNQDFGIDIALGADRVDITGVELRFNITGALRNQANATEHKVKISNCGGYNPMGFAAPQPSIPASGVATKNLSGYDCTVYVDSGTVSSIAVDGFGVFTSSGKSLFVPAGSTITLTYSVVPGWQWQGH